MTDALFGVAERVLRGGSIEADISMASHAGVDGLGIQLDQLQRVGARTIRRLLAEAGLRASSVMALGGIAEGRITDLPGLTAAFEASAAIGAPNILVYTGPLNRRTASEADESCRQWFRSALPIARDVGVGLMLEPMFPVMSEITYVHTLRHALRIVAPFDDGRVVVDTAHLWWEPELSDLVGAHLERIGSIQLSNVSRRALAARSFRRAPLGEGAVPLRELLRVFEASGYRGWYEHEVLLDDLADPVGFLRQERAWFHSVLREETRSLRPSGRAPYPGHPTAS